MMAAMDARRAAWTGFAPVFVGAVAAGTLHPEWVRAIQAAAISVAFMMFLFSPVWERRGNPVRLGGALGILGVALEPLAQQGFIRWALGMDLRSLFIIPLFTLLLLEFVQPAARGLPGTEATAARRAADTVLMGGTYLVLSALTVFALGGPVDSAPGAFLAQAGLALLALGAVLAWGPRAARVRPQTKIVDVNLQGNKAPLAADAK